MSINHTITSAYQSPRDPTKHPTHADDYGNITITSTLTPETTEYTLTASITRHAYTLEYKLNDGEYEPLPPSNKISLPLMLDDGENTILIRMNNSQVKTVTVTVDEGD